MKKSHTIKINLHSFLLGICYQLKGYNRLIRSAKIISEQGYDFNVLILGKRRGRKQIKKVDCQI